MKSLISSILTCLGGLVLAGGVAEAAKFEALTARNPFAPAGPVAGAGAGEAEQGPLEFRGVVVDETGTSYSIFDTTATKGYWVTAEDKNGPVQVKSYDAESGTLEVAQNGKPVKLTLKRAVIQAGQAVAAMIPAPAPMPPPGTQAKPPGQAANPNDARRLEAVAAEVRRRRALRNAAQNPAAAQQAPAAPAADVPSPPNPPLNP